MQRAPTALEPRQTNPVRVQAATADNQSRKSHFRSLDWSVESWQVRFAKYSAVDKALRLTKSTSCRQARYNVTVLSGPPPLRLVPPGCAWIHSELKRHRHVTLKLLWEEYPELYGAAAYRRSASVSLARIGPRIGRPRSRAARTRTLFRTLTRSCRDLRVNIRSGASRRL